jgi:hypothetical protein
MARKRTTRPKPPQSVKKATSVLPMGYQELLREIKERIRSAQLRASVAVNSEMIALYWQIGRDILIRQESEGWGTKVSDRLAADLRRAYPEMTGLSPRNVNYIRAYVEAWPKKPIVQQLVAQICKSEDEVVNDAFARLNQRRAAFRDDHPRASLIADYFFDTSALVKRHCD